MILGSTFYLLGIALCVAILAALCIRIVAHHSGRRRRAERLEIAFERAQSRRLNGMIA